MPDQHYQYVLLGGGLTSGSAAEAIRRHDAGGSILVVGQEVNRPYHRPRLNPDYLKREHRRAEIVVRPPGWFEQRHIDLSTGRRASHLDTARRTVTLDNGQEIAFDKLLIATGASAAPLHIPGAHLPNVFTLRSVDDADRLHNAIEKAKAGGLRHDASSQGFRAQGSGVSQGPDATVAPLIAHPSSRAPASRGVVAVIGAGLLGVELASTLTQLGLAVELIGDAPWPWRKYVGEYTGKVVAKHLSDHGVRLHLGSRPQRLDGDGRVQRVMLDANRTIPCDFVIVAVGAVPNREILRGTPITAEKAILADAHCQTNVPGIFAAGDCAAIFDPLFGKHRLIAHWENARITGEIAGANMAGHPVTYDLVNHFRTHAFDLQLAGWGEPRLVDHRYIRGDMSGDPTDFIEFGVATDGRIAQALAVGHDGEDQILEALVKARFAVNGNEEALKDPTSPLSNFIR